ncbi:MAG: hypothetical protein OIF57_03320 [Marinobacterium sp.]|nr:hypothetical protein [Marinobacterium sp.]
MKYGMTIGDVEICGPTSNLTHLAGIASRYGFAISDAITGPTSQTVAGQTLRILPGIEERPGPPAPVGYHGTLTQWILDVGNQRFVRTIDYQPLLFDAMVDQVEKHIAHQQDEALARIEHGYTAQEVKTWAQQQAEAERWAANAEAPVPLLSQLAQRRGVDISVVVSKIQAKVGQAAKLTGIVLGDAQAAAATLEQMKEQEKAGKLPKTWFEQLQGLAVSWRSNWPKELLGDE